MMGSCPTAPPPASGWERAADRYRRLAAPVLRPPLVVVTLLVLVVVSAWLPLRGELALISGFHLAAGAYCAMNFWRCREPHCRMTGPGWTATGLAGLVALVAGADWVAGLWATFTAVWVAGMAYEGRVRRRAPRDQPGPPSPGPTATGGSAGGDHDTGRTG